jgi:hypothetical protein
VTGGVAVGLGRPAPMSLCGTASHISVQSYSLGPGRNNPETYRRHRAAARAPGHLERTIRVNRARRARAADLWSARRSWIESVAIAIPSIQDLFESGSKKE